MKDGRQDTPAPGKRTGDVCHYLWRTPNRAQKSQERAKAILVIQSLATAITIVELEPYVGEHYGQIHAELEKQGRIIGNNDLWIASHARAKDWTVVTNNEREFLRVNELKVENWA